MYALPNLWVLIQNWVVKPVKSESQASAILLISTVGLFFPLFWSGSSYQVHFSLRVTIPKRLGTTDLVVSWFFKKGYPSKVKIMLRNSFLYTRKTQHLKRSPFQKKKKTLYFEESKRRGQGEFCLSKGCTSKSMLVAGVLPKSSCSTEHLFYYRLSFPLESIAQVKMANFSRFSSGRWIWTWDDPSSWRFPISFTKVSNQEN